MLTLAWICVGVAALSAFERLLHISINLVSSLLRGNCPEAFGFMPTCIVRPENCDRNGLIDVVEYPQLPTVLVQLPMFNEGEQALGVIRSACQLDWPVDRLLIQVLDDSTDQHCRDIVDSSIIYWRLRGINIEVHRRESREGFKGGALKEGMELPQVRDRYAFIAIFDADFRPQRDFLNQTIPYFQRADVGLVQARWSFNNCEESLLTRMQEIALNYHVKCEQYSRFAAEMFFNFNGTAGVWRTEAINAAGGWSGLTVTEDMDLSLRTYLLGWRSVFLRAVTCENELPTSYSAFRSQQFRWACGPMQVWRRINLWTKPVPASRWPSPGTLGRLWIAYFFLVSYLLGNLLTALLTIVLIPVAPFVLALWLPVMISTIIWLPAVLGMCLCTPTWRLDRYVMFVLFQNVMSLLKLTAVVSGLLDTKRAQSWVVTAKKGSDNDSIVSCRGNLNYLELMCGIYYVATAVLVFFVRGQTPWFYIGFSSYLFLQGFVFVSHGMGCLQWRTKKQLLFVDPGLATNPTDCSEWQNDNSSKRRERAQRKVAGLAKSR
jgi:beta-mannan synthase